MADLIGTTASAWTYPAGVPRNETYLCARLDVPLLWSGKVWTHVLKCVVFGVGVCTCLARIQGTSNVLNEWLFFGKFPGLNFPYGFDVEPDR